MRLVIAILLLASAALAKPTIAVLDPASEGVGGDEARIVGEAIRDTVVGAGQYQVQDRASMREILAQQTFNASEACDESCAVEQGRILQVRYLLSASLRRAQGTTWISLRLTDVESGAAVKAARDSCSCELREMVALAETLARQALGTQAAPAAAGPRAPPAPAVGDPPGALPPDLSEKPAGTLENGDLLVAYEDALRAESAEAREPGRIAAAWERVANAKSAADYVEPARERAQEWRDYGGRRAALVAKKTEMTEQLTKLLPLASFEASAKEQLLAEYAELFGKDVAPLLALAAPADFKARACARFAAQAPLATVRVEGADERGYGEPGRVFADGREVGEGAGTYQVPACTGRIGVMADDGTRVDEPVTLSPGATREVQARLPTQSDWFVGVFLSGLVGRLPASASPEEGHFLIDEGYDAQVWLDNFAPLVGGEVSAKFAWKLLYAAVGFAWGNTTVKSLRGETYNADGSHRRTIAEGERELSSGMLGLEAGLLVPLFDSPSFHLSAGGAAGVGGISDYHLSGLLIAELPFVAVSLDVSQGFGTLYLDNVCTGACVSVTEFSSETARLELPWSPLAVKLGVSYRFAR